MKYNLKKLIAEAGGIFRLAGSSNNLEVVRERLFRRITRYQFDFFDEEQELATNIVRVRDCTRAMRSILSPQSDKLSGFSVTQALFDIAHDKKRPDLQAGFYAELIHIIMGMHGRGPGLAPADQGRQIPVSGRRAAMARSRELDKIGNQVEDWMSHYEHGLKADVILKRRDRKKKICAVLGATENDWNDWRWQLKNVIKKLDILEKLVTLTDTERENIKEATTAGVPFGVLPYYLHLMDTDNGGRDRAIRAQVFPPANYIKILADNKGNHEFAFDFMLERDTSPVDLITRRPGTIGQNGSGAEMGRRSSRDW